MINLNTIDTGNVIGAVSSTDNAITVFNGITGKLIKDAGGISSILGALQTTGVGTGTVAGNARGVGAVDLQVNRTTAIQVSSGANSGIFSGNSNTASGQNAVTAGGYLNVGSGANSAILGGIGNLASGGYAIIGGGYGNSASNSYSSVLGGFQAKSDKYAQHAQAGGQFTTQGDAQTSVLVARKITTDATPTEIFLDNVSARLVLANDTSWLFEISLIARRSDIDDTSAAFNFRGAIDRNANAASTALVGMPAKTVIARDDASYDADVSAEVTNGSLKITVTGVTGHTIRWVSRITLTEVTG